VPAFSINNANQLRRFIVLVDVLYERQVRSR
jgi:predicted ATPase